MKRLVSFLICLAVAISAHGSTLDGATVIIPDASGSGAGVGVTTATDGQGLREAVLRRLLVEPWLDGAGMAPTIAVLTCNDHPTWLLLPTSDRKAIAEFAKGLRLASAGGTSIDATLELLRQVPGRPRNIIYIGDGLVTRVGTPSSLVVSSLPAALTRIYGTAPAMHMIAVDSSGQVISRTKAAWTSITTGRVAAVADADDVAAAVAATARGLNWKQTTPRPGQQKSASTQPNPLAVAIGAALILLAGLLLLKVRKSRSRLSAFITIEENGRTRRTSASTFGKSELSIGEGDCDVKVSKWSEPIRLHQREVRDPRGRKRQQTVAQHGNRSVILGGTPALFRNGATTIKVRGGRR
jgi:hypothetical protein